jgi:hypothetical protein
METTQMSNRTSNRKSKAVNFKDFRYEEGHSDPQRAAQALDWAAEQFPEQWVAYNILLRAIRGFSHTPKLASRDVENLRHKMSRVREILRRVYSRDLISEPGVGVRATSASLDVLKTAMVQRARRLASASTNYAATAALVEASEIPATEANRPWLQWWKSSVKQTLAVITDDGYLRKLLAPVEEEKK